MDTFSKSDNQSDSINEWTDKTDSLGGAIDKILLADIHDKVLDIEGLSNHRPWDITKSNEPTRTKELIDELSQTIPYAKIKELLSAEINKRVTDVYMWEALDEDS